MGAKEFDEKRQRNASGDSTVSSDSMTNYIPTPPDGGWGWVVVLASFINHIIVDGITFTFGVFYLEFLDFFKESKGKTALVGSLLAGFYLMAGPIASALVNRYGCRPVCVAGSLISSVAFVLATFSTSVDILMITYGVLGGFGFGLIYLPSVISVSYYFEKKRALATGIAVCGAGVGGFIFAPAGRMLLTKFDWKNGLYVVAGVVLNAAVCGMLMRPLEPPKQKKPRRKNFFDRFREKAFGRNRSESADGGTIYSVTDQGTIAQGVHEAKLAREQRLREEEGSEIGSLPNSRMSSMKHLDGRESRSPSNVSGFNLPSHPGSRSTSRNNSLAVNQEPTSPINGPNTLPAIVVNQIDDGVKEDLANDHDDSEKAKMLKKDEDKSSKSGSKSKLNSTEERKLSKGQAALPPHMRREMMIEGISRNGSLPHKLQHSCSYNEELTPLNSQLKPEDSAKLSMSTGNVLVLTPRKRRRRPEGVQKEDYARPLYRRDIFYSGSVLHIPQFRSQPNVNKYVASITTIPDAMPPEKEGRIWGCLPIPKTAKDILKQMLDVSLLKDPVFLIACLGEVFGFIGLFIPFVYVTERAIQLGVPATQASFLLSVIGITNTIGRIMAGFLADFKWVNSLLLHNVMMILGGVACIANMFCTTYPLMIAYAAFFGLSVATYISLTSIILCNLMGLEKLTSAFGFLTLVRGVSSIAGPPAAGLVFEATGDYDMSFHVGGAMFILAGLFYCILHLPYFTAKAKHMQDIPLPEPDIHEVIVTPPEVTIQEPSETDEKKPDVDEEGLYKVELNEEGNNTSQTDSNV